MMTCSGEVGSLVCRNIPPEGTLMSSIAYIQHVMHLNDFVTNHMGAK